MSAVDLLCGVLCLGALVAACVVLSKPRSDPNPIPNRATGWRGKPRKTLFGLPTICDMLGSEAIKGFGASMGAQPVDITTKRPGG